VPLGFSVKRRRCLVQDQDRWGNFRMAWAVVMRRRSPPQPLRSRKKLESGNAASLTSTGVMRDTVGIPIATAK